MLTGTGVCAVREHWGLARGRWMGWCDGRWTGRWRRTPEAALRDAEKLAEERHE